ncbi:MAG: TonB-dependent receptor [Bacteroidales bacterium]|nr:TonB-dependent receptor [Bacteroidales bacterium]
MILRAGWMGWFLALMAFQGWCQGTGTVSGRITDEKGKPMELVNVAISGLPGGTVTDRNGNYELSVPAGNEVFVVVSFIGYRKEVEAVVLAPGERREVNISLVPVSTDLPEVEVEDEQIRQTNLIRIDPKIATVIPTVSEGIPTLLKTLPGVTSTSELSSQYSVRGGNFDENLIYVNDIEIYRPFLIRSGQQEGLSFVNSDLVSSLLFSAGGFEAKYGDKMSSVLDIQYRKPSAFGGSASVGLLGGSFHLEGLALKRKFSYLLGVRHKTNEYLLKTLEVKGDYKPSFTDVQGLMGYHISPKVELSFLGNASINHYELVPESRQTDFGTYQQARRLTIYFEGQEVDEYMTWLGGLTLTYKPARNIRLKLIASGYQATENETYDILGQYFIGLVETNQASEEFGNVIETQGVGSFLDHARNRMDAEVYNIGHRGSVESGHRFLQWGVNFQQEKIDDRMNEWAMIDSAGYSLPRPPDSVGYTHPAAQPYIPFEIHELIKSRYTLNTSRLSGFIQHTWGNEPDSAGLSFTAGIRSSYWDLNGQLLFSPRASLAWDPGWEWDILFRLSAGFYYQPPFYKEMKDLKGRINPSLKAQESYQVVAGSDWNFKAWNRPFKFVTEVYYKYLNRLVPYIVDNVRLRYYAANNSRGYAAGIEMKVNGEFVRGIESWASLSVMRTEEDITDDVATDASGNTFQPGYIPRPTDQRVTFSMFFQDYLPRNPTYKISLTLLFGTGLPFGPPDSEKYRHTFRMPPYRRVDIGFSKEIIGEMTRFTRGNPFRVLESLWLTAEVLNLFQVNNTVSYTWVTDIYGLQYAVPNYLTPRQINVRLIARF